MGEGRRFETRLSRRSEARRAPPLLGQRDGPWCKTRQGSVFSALFTPQQVGGSNRELSVKTETSEAGRGQPPQIYRYLTPHELALMGFIASAYRRAA